MKNKISNGMSNKKIIVKMSTHSPTWSFKRQTPNENGIWGNLEFYIDDDINDCDWFVVFGGITKEQKINCYPENTILITDEPSSIKKYDIEFTKQFNTIITIQKSIIAPNIIYKQLLPYYVGACYNKITKKFDKFNKSYDELKEIDSTQKTKLISVISSNKNKTKGHKERLNFIKILKKHFGDKIDIYGLGINEISDKWDAISPYRYHIVIENSLEENYWTEKLADAYLAESYPIYYGDPNINDYFTKNSLTKIDINNPFQAIKQIEHVIKNDYYNKFKKEILKSKERVLNHYQIFPELYEIINKLEKERTNDKKISLTIKPEKIKKTNIVDRKIGQIGLKLKNKYPNIYLQFKKIWKKII